MFKGLSNISAKINVEALIKHTNPTKNQNGWVQPKISARQLAGFKKFVTRSLKQEWPLPEVGNKLLPERPPKTTIWERNYSFRQKKIQEAINNIPKQLAEKMKAAREKKKKETENNLTILVPNYVKGGPYTLRISNKVNALKKQAVIDKEKQKADFITQAMKKKTTKASK
ncbi:hypothetical protein DLAC_06116 [Tieghemostelium lacteum]|uniref:MRPL25 domain-containing protein n=1 Tax=Tieghemostelium lacteum TaxID=361077 RepID=A0A151ZHI4_TIELA|nr:hypothetical protein DLAC_06116 [Tieghemostelium lacteum]|eukprot:KYQ93426.1 hypothetical protein DLAC_06116 [Tieghemostelium lacteum]